MARHVLSKVRGQFTEFSGRIEVGDSPQDSRVAVEVKTGWDIFPMPVSRPGFATDTTRTA